MHPFLTTIGSTRSAIDSEVVRGLQSDDVLAHIRPGLEDLGFQVETGKGRSQQIHRPVMFGEKGAELVTYEIDGWKEDRGIVVEVEAGRGLLGNAIYRDLIRTPLIVDARFLALGVMKEHHYRSGGKSMINR